MIDIQFEDVDGNLIPSDLIPWILKCIKHLNQTVEQITYVFVTDERMIELNNQALSHNYATDILTFDLRDNQTLPLDAEIIISIDTVLSNSKIYNCSFVEEIKRVMIHGVLHLVGFDDHSPEDIEVMRSKENFYLNF